MAARRPVDYVWAAARIAIGWIFLWAFLDKTFGWGFATPANRAGTTLGLGNLPVVRRTPWLK
ncbi:hypothetical protein ETD85_07950 [Nonomuraea zeae]|uniref:DoxX family protein n=1 Tax=Nonomuraea zeae TaxID=1642303 RepID=A0A5S4GXI0_9ACTN|nr:hypothetical protein ETD85_07950 [Nonomuraea zeae]